MTDTISYAVLAQTIGNHIGAQDVPCPRCGPDRRSAANRRRKVLRVWHTAPGFMTYSCARCGARGYVRAENAGPARRTALREAKTETRSAIGTVVAKCERARRLWRHRQPIEDTLAEIYLRGARRYSGRLPGTLGFLPDRPGYPPAMIAAFGTVDETEPGIVSISPAALMGVHLTRLAPDGGGKAGTEADKIMIGTPRGSPIVVAMPSDLGGLAITEGIEDALPVHEATGLGAWAAGSASFMPALADAEMDRVDHYCCG
jgi:hypothetical protein